MSKDDEYDYLFKGKFTWLITIDNFFLNWFKYDPAA